MSNEITQYTIHPKGFNLRDLHAERTYGMTICEMALEKAADKIPEWIAEFKAHGFNVTEEAIRHNLEAWADDSKSGYRDDANGYHLFSPCGCNPLRFDATTLTPLCENWQETYIA